MATTTGSLPRPRLPADAPPALPDLIAGRFRVETVVRRGAVTTLLAADETTAMPVVVKLAAADRVSRGTRLRLQQEAAVLRLVDAPSLAVPVAVGEDGALFYVASPRLPGRALADLLAERPLEVTETLRVATDVLRGLAAAHAHGVVHRAIRPSNVVVSTGPVTRAVLVDIGYSRLTTLAPDSGERAAAATRYVSPEQAGSLHRSVDERSDLYSVGALLYHCLTHTAPYDGADVGEILRAQLSGPLPDVRARVPQVPAALAALVSRLLRREPRDRYQSAAGVLADVDELAALLRTQPNPDFALGRHDRRATLTEPAFVGRAQELGALLDGLDDAVAGIGQAVLVEAPSGGGKTRLLDELVGRCTERGVTVLRGQGTNEGARPPFQLLEGVAAGAAARVAGDTGLAERIRSSVAEDAPVLAGVLPQLAAIVGDASLSGEQGLGPEEFGESRALAVLVKFLDALGAPDRPALVVLDDCQWADEATVRLLYRWQREAPAARHICIVAAYRQEEVSAEDILARVTTRRLTLRGFTADDVRLLVESMSGPIPPEALDVVTTLSAGSPFMASAVLRGLVESGALFFDRESWRADATLLQDAQSSQEAAAFLASRLALLDPGVLRLLSAAAVLGKTFDVELAAALVDVPAAAALSALHGLRDRHLLWLDPDGLEATFVHDKLRETLLTRLDPQRRRAWHARAALLLAHRPGEVPSYDLAFHFHAAGDDRSALPHALRAAAEARSRHALTAADEQYRIALGGIEPDDRETARTVQAGLGDVLMLRGQYDEAAEAFAAALALAGAGAQRAELELRLGELAFKRGEVVDSVGWLETALRSLHRRVPQHRPTFLLFAVWEVLVQVAHCLLPRRWVARRRLERGATDILAARICSRLAYSYWFSAGRLPTAWAHIREMNMLERYPETPELAQAYSEHAPVMTTLPWNSRGIAYVRRSLEIRRRFGDVWGQGQSLHFYGVVLYAASQFREAINVLGEAIRLLDRTGDAWERNTALWHIGFCHYRLGETEAATAALNRCYRDALEIGDHQAAAIALSGLAKTTGGGVSAEALQAQLDKADGDHHTSAELRTAEAVRLLAAGDAPAAVRVLEETAAALRRSGVRNEYVAPVLPWLATALRVAAEETGPYRLPERRVLLRRGRAVARRAHRLARAYSNNLPHALRERAALAALSGHPRRAARYLQRGLGVAERQEMAAELAMLGEVAAAGATGAAPARPRLPLPVYPAPEPAALPSLSLVDRFDALLRIGRALAATLAPDAVFDVIRLAALELLRAQQCTVVPLADFEAAGALVTRAARERAVVVDVADPPDAAGQQPASALAAPVVVRGRVVACWLVVHHEVSGLFGADEMRLAEFVSALAGAALENAEGFAQVQALSQSLERRVDERTAELSVANDALRSTLDELERANGELRRLDELKSDFVAMVSHELRSPLTSILGYCSTMLRHWERVDDERKRGFIEIIERQSRWLTSLVNDLLEMSRIESGRLDTQLEPLVLRPALAEVVAAFRGRLPDLDPDGDVDAVVLADGEHVRRVLINLLDNAVKYGEAPVRLEVSRAAEVVRIAVRDHGPGVPADFRPRLFDKFAQASSGSTRRATGTGLGLSIVKGLVESMGGTVTYEAPDAGRGGAFVVSLRAAS